MHDLIAPSIRLRPAREADARFILDLRLDERLSRFLSQVDDDLEKQREWLRKYEQRESQGQEYYFIIESHAGHPYGTVRVYDLRPDSFSWGSWILAHDRPQSAAIESTLAIYDFGFYELQFPKSHFDVRKDNEKVIRYHQRFGAHRTGEDELNVFFEFTREDYDRVRPDYARFVSAPSSGGPAQ
jgi:RimJ/RimL family protein N-acetyltransferase